MSGPEAFSAELATTPSTNVVKEAMYVAVVGSRHYPEPECSDRVANLVGLLHTNACVVSGGAPGPDKAAERFAAERGLRAIVVRPSRETSHGTAADYFCRNLVIVRGSDIVVAFWDGQSNGTRDSIEHALTVHNFVIVAMPGRKAEVWSRYLVPARR